MTTWKSQSKLYEIIYVNLPCDKHTTDDHISYLSHWCVYIWMDFFPKTEVWNLFLALTCQNLVAGEGVEDSWLFVTAVEGAGQW